MNTATKRRPGPVTLIALFQFARATFVLLIVLIIWVSPSMHVDSRLDIQAITYIAARRDISPVLLPISAVFLAAVGVGLWQLKIWARLTLMTTSGLTVLSWLRRFWFDWATGHVTLESDEQRHIILAVMFIDSVVFGCLAFYPDVADAFRDRTAGNWDR
jgi:hypothetical protein